MPAQGRGAFLKPRAKAPAPKPVPNRAPAPVRHISSGPFSSSLPQHPFAPAQRQAAAKGKRAQQAQPAIPHPNIPRLPNPTRQQINTAMAIAKAARAHYLGPNPTPQARATYEREVQTDPRLHEYRETLRHYIHAHEGTFAAQAGRGGERLLPQPGILGNVNSRTLEFLSRFAGPPGKPQSPRAAQVQLGKELLAGAQGRSEAKPGQAPSGIHIPIANIKIPTGQIAAAVSREIPKLAPGLASATPETKFFKNALGDVKGIGEFPFIGGLAAYKSLAAGVQGNLTPAKDLLSGIAEGFEKGAVGQLVQGDLKGVGEAVRQHPVYSLLEADAALSAVGRPTSTLLRETGAADRSRVRPARSLTNESGLDRAGIVKQMRYSSSPHREFVQRLLDSKRLAQKDVHGRPVTIKELGHEVPVLRSSDTEVRRYQKQRANYRSMRAVNRGRYAREAGQHAYAAAQRTEGRLPIAVRRANVKHSARQIKGLGPTHTVGTAVDSLARLVASGTIRSAKTFHKDLDGRIREIRDALARSQAGHAAGEGETVYRHKGDRSAAIENLKQLEAFRRSKLVMDQVPTIVKRGEAFGRALNKAEKEYPPGLIEEARLAHGKLSEVAIRHLAAEHIEGVHPEALRKYNDRVAAVGRAKQRLGEAQSLVKKEEAAARKLTAKHKEDRRVQMRVSKGAIRSIPGQAEEKALRDRKLKAAKAEVKDAQKAVRAAEKARGRKPRATGRFEVSGKPLDLEDVRQHLQDSGRNPDTVAYLPHEVNPEQAQKYYKQYRTEGRPTISVQERRGHLYKAGATDIAGDAVLHELARKGTVSAYARQFDTLVSEVGTRMSPEEIKELGEKMTPRERKKLEAQDGYYTPEQGKDRADKLKHDTGQDWIPIRAQGASHSTETKLAIRSSQQPGALMETAQQGLLNDRLNMEGSQAANVVLAPAHEINQLQAQIQPSGSLARKAQLLNGAFRFAVLSQPRWLAGNFLEPFFIRLPLSGSGVNLPGLALDMRAASKFMAALEKSNPETAAEIRSIYGAGRFVGGGRSQSPYRGYADLPEGSKQRALYFGAHMAMKVPAIRAFKDILLAIPKGFFAVNRYGIENPTAYAALGKAVREDLRDMQGHWLDTVKIGEQAMDELAHGAINTATQHRYAERYWELLGQYDGWGPNTKRAIRTFFPFVPWTLASMRFVYWTLPAHHTVAFTALLKAGQSILPEWEAEHAGTPPGTLRDAIIGRDKGLVDIAHYTPFGVSIPLSQARKQKEFFEPFISTFGPQFMGTIAYAKGEDPFGRELQFSGGAEHSSSEEWKGLAEQVLETLLPVIGTARRIKEGGGTAYADSTVLESKTKPGTKYESGFNRALNPFRETHLKAPVGGEEPAQPQFQLTPRQQHRLEKAQSAAEGGLTLRQQERLKRAERALARK